MADKDFHISFRDAASISLLFAALEKSFPLFRRFELVAAVDGGGKGMRQEVFQTLRAFSTGFPQYPVDVKAP